MAVIEANDLTKVYRSYRKERGLWGSIKGLVKRQYTETAPRTKSRSKLKKANLSVSSAQRSGQDNCSQNALGLLNPTSGQARVLGFIPWERRNEMKRQFSLLMGQKTRSGGTCPRKNRSS
jgi:ABC-2 type transport system ATP-binding protein